jgi:hypothetical protein
VRGPEFNLPNHKCTKRIYDPIPPAEARITVSWKDVKLVMHSSRPAGYAHHPEIRTSREGLKFPH